MESLLSGFDQDTQLVEEVFLAGCFATVDAEKKIEAGHWSQLLDESPPQTARMIVAALIMLENLSLAASLDGIIADDSAWRRTLNFSTSMMMRALYSDDEKAINGANVGLLRWKLSGKYPVLR